MTMHIDKIMGGRVRDKESIISTTPGGNEELKQFIQNLINNSTISLDQILGISNISNELKTSISILMELINGTHLEVGDEITVEMKQYFDNLLQSITDTIQMIIDSPNVNPEFKTYLQNLLQSITNAFAQIIVGGVVTTELKTLIDNLLQTLTEAINQVTINSITNELKDYINQILNVNGEGSRLISGSVVWLQNLDFLVSPLVYSIFNKRIESTQKTVTIPANTSENPMFAIIIADIFGNVSYVLGTPSATPAVPTVNPSTQLLITQIYIPAYGTAPGVDPDGNNEEIVTETIYNENIEWATAKTEETGVSIDLEATTDPAVGVKHIKFGFVGGDSTGIALDLITTRKTAIYNGKSLRMSEDYHEMFPGHDDELILSLSDLFPDHKTDFSGVDNLRHIIFYKIENPTDLIIRGTILNQYNSPYNVYCSHVENETYEIPELNFSVEIPGYLFFARMDGEPVITNENYQLSIHDFSRNDQKFGNSTVTTVSPSAAFASFTRATEIDCKGGVFSLSLKNSIAWSANTGILIDLYNAATKVGSLTILPNQYHGFNPASTEYQRINLSFADFNPTGTKITKMQILPVNEWPNGLTFNVDNVTLQTGVTKPTGEVTHAEILKLIADEIAARESDIYSLQQLFSNYVDKTTDQTVSGKKAFSVYPEIAPANHTIGNTGPAGGLIFFDKGYTSDGWRYLECANLTGFVSKQWTSVAKTTLEANNTDMGGGLENTQKIAESEGFSGGAATACLNLVSGGKSDFYLPNYSELMALFNSGVIRPELIEGLTFWASNDFWNPNIAYTVFVENGQKNIQIADKWDSYFYFPIRKFAAEIAQPTNETQLVTKKYVDEKFVTVVSTPETELTDNYIQVGNGLKTIKNSNVRIENTGNGSRKVLQGLSSITLNNGGLNAYRMIIGEAGLETNKNQIQSFHDLIFKGSSTISAVMNSTTNVWTFDKSPIVPTPSSEMEVSTKGYVDNQTSELAPASGSSNYVQNNPDQPQIGTINLDGSIKLTNDQAFVGKTASGSERSLAKVDSNNDMRFGDKNYNGNVYLENSVGNIRLQPNGNVVLSKNISALNLSGTNSGDQDLTGLMPKSNTAIKGQVLTADGNGESIWVGAETITITDSVIDMAMGDSFYINLTENKTFTVSNQIKGKQISIIINPNGNNVSFESSRIIRGFMSRDEVNYVTLRCIGMTHTLVHSLSLEIDHLSFDSVAKDTILIGTTDGTHAPSVLLYAIENSPFLCNQGQINNRIEYHSGLITGAFGRGDSNLNLESKINSTISIQGYLNASSGQLEFSEVWDSLYLMTPSIRYICLPNLVNLMSFNQNTNDVDLSIYTKSYYIEIKNLFNFGGSIIFPAEFDNILERKTIDISGAFTSITPPVSGQFRFTITAPLQASEVNKLLIAADNGWTGYNCWLSIMGASASPTGDGIIAKNSLIAKGYGVLTN